ERASGGYREGTKDAKTPVERQIVGHLARLALDRQALRVERLHEQGTIAMEQQIAGCGVIEIGVRPQTHLCSLLRIERAHHRGGHGLRSAFWDGQEQEMPPVGKKDGKRVRHLLTAQLGRIDWFAAGSRHALQRPWILAEEDDAITIP